MKWIGFGDGKEDRVDVLLNLDHVVGFYRIRDKIVYETVRGRNERVFETEKEAARHLKKLAQKLLKEDE